MIYIINVCKNKMYIKIYLPQEKEWKKYNFIIRIYFLAELQINSYVAKYDETTKKKKGITDIK